jgi:hypothetical protein
VDTGGKYVLNDVSLKADHQPSTESPMPINLLGKLLFPRLPSWERRRRAITVLIVLLISISFAVIVGAVMYYSNSRR